MKPQSGPAATRPIGPFPPTARPIPEGARATRVPSRHAPQMSLKERDRRWDRARKKMLMAGLDALVFLGNDIYWGMGMANMRYMLQVDSQLGGEGIFPLSGEPVAWTGVPHMNRPTNMYLSLQDWLTDFRTRGGVAAVADELKARGLERSKLGLVGFSSTIQTTPTLLHDDVAKLKALLPDAQFVAASWIIEEMRMVKSEEEIEMLRSAGKVARKVIDAMVETARPGVPEAAVYAEMIKTQIANGGEPNIFNLFASGPVEHSADELWHLLHGCEQPLAPTMRPLAAGDLVIAEWHTKYGGYRCHTEFSVYLGKRAPRELLNIWNVSVECLQASKQALAAGRTIGEALEIIRKPAERAGLDWVELGFHAMGTASPEFPTVVYKEGYGANTLNGHRILDMVLEEGMTFGNNIDLHDSRWKPDVGTMLSDFMVVRPREAECLIGTPTELPQIG
jgi:Xaa-Pro aminopeptidase